MLPVLPPWGTGFAASQLQRLGLPVPVELLQQLRFGRGLDNRRLKASGYAYSYTTREAVLKLRAHQRLRPLLRSGAESYRYEREVEEFLYTHPKIADVQVVGVQSDGYPSWPEAFAAGGAVAIVPNTIADGTTAPFTDVMFERLGALVHEWVIVPEGDMRAAIARLATTAKVVAEGAGALAFTAMQQETERSHTVAILSGGNLDPSLLGELLTA